MNIPRRGFLGAFISMLGTLSLRSRTTCSTGSEFPFLKEFRPYPLGEPTFPAITYEPSFLHPNGKWVVLPSSEGGFELWDWAGAFPVRRFDGIDPGDIPTGYCNSTGLIRGCFSGNGEMWISGESWSGGDSGCRIHGASCEADGSWAGHSAQGWPSAIDPNTPFIHCLGGDEPGIFRISTQDGTLEPLGPGPLEWGKNDSTWWAAISSNGRWMLKFHPGSDPENGQGHWAVWELPKGPCRAVREGSAPKFNRPDFSLDGRCVYLSTGRREWIHWNWAGQAVKNPEFAGLWTREAFGPDALKTPDKKHTLTRRGQGLIDVNSENGQLVNRLVAFPPNSQMAAFGRSSHHLLLAEPGGVTRLWNRKGPIRKIPGVISEFLERPAYSEIGLSNIRCLLWSRDGRWVVTGNDQGGVACFDTTTFRIPNGTPKDELAQPNAHWFIYAHSSPIRSLAMIDSSIFALAMDGKAAWINHLTTQITHTWQAHSHRGTAIGISADSTLLATGGVDGLAVWNLPGLTLRKRFALERSGVSALSVHPKLHRTSAVFSDGSAALFDLSNGLPIWNIPQAHKDVAAGVAFHPSGRWIATYGWDGELVIWEAESGSEVARIHQGLGYGISGLAWSRDGQRLALGGVVFSWTPPSSIQELTSFAFHWDEDCT